MIHCESLQMEQQDTSTDTEKRRQERIQWKCNSEIRRRAFLSAKRLPKTIDLSLLFYEAGTTLEWVRCCTDKRSGRFETLLDPKNDCYLGPSNPSFDASLRLIEKSVKQLRQLARQLRRHRHITYLDLSFNSLGPYGMLVLAGSIAKLTNLRSLNLEGMAFICFERCWRGYWLEFVWHAFIFDIHRYKCVDIHGYECACNSTCNAY